MLNYLKFLCVWGSNNVVELRILSYEKDGQKCQITGNFLSVPLLVTRLYFNLVINHMGCST